jgi:hypothetical protein
MDKKVQLENRLRAYYRRELKSEAPPLPDFPAKQKLDRKKNPASRQSTTGKSIAEVIIAAAAGLVMIFGMSMSSSKIPHYWSQNAYEIMIEPGGLYKRVDTLMDRAADVWRSRIPEKE